MKILELLSYGDIFLFYVIFAILIMFICVFFTDESKGINGEIHIIQSLKKILKEYKEDWQIGKRGSRR